MTNIIPVPPILYEVSQKLKGALPDWQKWRPQDLSIKEAAGAALVALSGIGMAQQGILPGQSNWAHKLFFGEGFFPYTLTMAAAIPVGLALEGIQRKREKKENEATKNSDDSLVQQATHPSIPYVGALAGVAAGSLGNFLHNASLFIKDNVAKTVHGKTTFKAGPFCSSGPYGKDSFLTSINHHKQWEISTFAIATPFLPLITPSISLVSQSIQERDHSQPSYLSVPKKLGEKLSEIPGSRMAYTGALLLGTFMANSYLNALSRTPNSPLNAFHPNGSNFDVSGHVMLKMALATCLSQSIESVRKTGHRTQAIAWGLFGASIAATDAVMMFNTGLNCHTVAEVGTGLLASAAVHAMASGVERLTKHLSNRN